MSTPAKPEAPPPAYTSASPELPDSPAAAQLRADGHALLAALQRFNTTLRAQGVGLTEEERRSGVGKLHTDEAPQLARVARYAAEHPGLVKGLAAKDGGADMQSFETDLLLDHLSVHQTARDLLAAFDRESDALHSLLGDLAIHRGALARPPLLAAYRTFATLAQHDLDVRAALQPVIEFFERASGRSSTPKAEG